jgi:hypothetical protein
VTARRRVEHVFQLFAAGAKVVEDPPLLHYVLGDRRAVVVNLPARLVFREGGRPRYAHGLGNTHHELRDHPMAPREGFVLLDCDDWTGASPEGETWWFKRDPNHARQQTEEARR